MPPPAAAPRVNHYKEMGLDNAGSGGVMVKIAASLGFSLTKKGKSAAKGGVRSTSIARSNTTGKTTSGLARKKILAGGAMDFTS